MKSFKELPKFTTRSAAKKLTGISYLAGLDSSAKVKKGNKKGYATIILYLAPHTLSGYNTCSMSTENCRNSCIFFTGRSKFDQKIQDCRIKRTKLFYENRQFFMAWLTSEINGYIAKCKRDNKIPVVRLNGTSDLNPLLFNYAGNNILDIYSDIQFYDYTKVYNRFKQLNHQLSRNYHLTYSYTGEGNSAQIAHQVLRSGNNVAIVFDTKRGADLPTSYQLEYSLPDVVGRIKAKVIDGDKTDVRTEDPKPAIVGLRFKDTKTTQKLKGKNRTNFYNNNKFIVNV